MFAWNIKCPIFFKIYLFSLCYPGLKPWDITLTLKFHWNIWAAVFVISNLSCNIASTVASFFWPPICYVWPPFYFRSPKGSFKETWVWGTACFFFFFFTVVIPHVVRSIYQTLWLRHLSVKDSSFGPKDTVLIQFRNISSPVIHCTHSGCLVSLVFILGRVVTKISSCWVYTTSRRGIKWLGISFGSIFLLFSNKSSWGPLS